jgi:hypothetical protein
VIQNGTVFQLGITARYPAARQYVRNYPGNVLISAESGFCRRVGGALRLISSFIAAPAVTGVLGPDMPGGRVRRACRARGYHRRLPVVAAAAGVRPGCSAGARHNGPWLCLSMTPFRALSAGCGRACGPAGWLVR